MKKINLIILCFTMLYIGMTAGLFFIWETQQQNNATEYRVEISRFRSNIISDFTDYEKGKRDKIINIPIQKKAYKSIQKVTYLLIAPSTQTESQRITKEKEEHIELAFYKPRNGFQMEVLPIEQNNHILGYMRFDYVRPKEDTLFLQVSISALTLLYVISILFYLKIKQHLVKPFQKLSQMPYELAKGNLALSIPESKDRYFGKFLWGIEMLRDSIAFQKEKELRLEKEKKMILLSISHDIKTPLNAINLYAKALEEGFYETKEERKNVAEQIQNKVLEMNRFVVEIIRTSSEDILNMEVKVEDFYLNELLEKVKMTYIERSRLKQVNLQIDAAENMLLHADLDRLYEAVGNMIENAYKYGDGKVIHMYVTKEEQFLLLHIFNSGIPLPEGEIPHVFESFFRGSNVKENQGNGLGLYICSEIMKKMMGDIYANNGKDGMEFVLVIPIA